MGGALVAECNFLLKWAREQGYWPVGLAGVSMGGHMACLACTNSPEPIALVPCLSWTTASTVFVQVILSLTFPESFLFWISKRLLVINVWIS